MTFVKLVILDARALLVAIEAIFLKTHIETSLFSLTFLLVCWNSLN